MGAGGSSAAAAGSSTAIGEKLECFTDDFEFAAFFSSFLVVPGVHLEAAFDVGTASFGEVLLGEFRLASPESDVHEGGVLLFLALVVIPYPVDSKGDIRHGGALGGVAQFGIPGEVPDEHDFVQIGHSDGENAERGGGTQEKTTVLANNPNQAMRE